MIRVFYGLIFLCLGSGSAQALEFTLHKRVSGKPGPTLLVIGGIQGDEPGGFTAASFLVNDYQIKSGEIWVVPNLNFNSIIQGSRGIHGDMNRKFSSIVNTDPEFEAIAKIKSIIKDKQVDMVLNLHDGSGFYNEKYIDEDENPGSWGQSVVIDQSGIEGARFGNLAEIAATVIARVNKFADDSKSRFFLKNTNTRKGDKDMEKTLTYFAINNGKPAMGIEVSKNYPTHLRTLQHLRILEAVMDTMNIEYAAHFELSAQGVKDKIGRDIQLAMFDNKLLFDLDDPRSFIRFVPMEKRSELEFTTNNPLVAVIVSDAKYKVRYGNRGVTTLSPQHFHFDNSLQNAEFEIDGATRIVQLGTIVRVNEHFSVTPIEGHRVNVIGYQNASHKNETGLVIHKEEILPRYSVDNQAQKFRVEFYKGEKYSGMVLVDFSAVDNKLAKNSRP